MTVCKAREEEMSECITKGCTKVSKARGLCVDCYGAATYAVRAKKVTWDKLVFQGLALESQRVKSTFRLEFDKTQPGYNRIIEEESDVPKTTAELAKAQTGINKIIEEELPLDPSFSWFFEPMSQSGDGVNLPEPRPTTTGIGGMHPEPVEPVEIEPYQTDEGEPIDPPAGDFCTRAPGESDADFTARLQVFAGQPESPNSVLVRCADDCVGDCDTCEKSSCGGHVEEQPELPEGSAPTFSDTVRQFNQEQAQKMLEIKPTEGAERVPYGIGYWLEKQTEPPADSLLHRHNGEPNYLYDKRLRAHLEKLKSEQLPESEEMDTEEMERCGLNPETGRRSLSPTEPPKNEPSEDDSTLSMLGYVAPVTPPEHPWEREE